MTRAFSALLAVAVLLAACGGAGSGGATAPTKAGTEQPKQYDQGKTAAPSGSPDGYYGY